MIEFHYCHTPNAWKVAIMLEETEFPNTRRFYSLQSGDHLNPTFRQLNPNNKLPAIRDLDEIRDGAPLAVFESGAILIYLAEKCGKFLSADPADRSQVMKWLMWQMSGLGPTAGQLAHFVRYSPPGQDYALERFRKELVRLANVMEFQLKRSEYLAGEYSIADMASWPIMNALSVFAPIGINLPEFENITRWIGDVGRRAAVARAMNHDDVPDHIKANPAKLTEEQWSNLYGRNQLAAAID